MSEVITPLSSQDIVDLALTNLMEAELVSQQDIERAQSFTDGQDVSSVLRLNQLGLITDEQMLDLFCRITDLPSGQISPIAADAVSSPLDPGFMQQTKCLMLEASGPLYLIDPSDSRIENGVAFTLGHVPEQVVLISAGDWSNAYQLYFASDPEDIARPDDDMWDPETALIRDQDRDAPVVRMVNNWINNAADQNASDIHFEAKRNSIDVQYRLDGRLVSVSKQPSTEAQSIIARIKVLADLDLGERNRSQDGRATVIVRGRKIDIRVSIVPTLNGESAVVRLLDRSTALLSLDALGFPAQTVQELTTIVGRRHGLFIVSGPTGSGKTTTLYACIQLLQDRGLKILSIEDPVEYQFEHVNQVQVSEKAGRTFSTALRSFLRHDPDVIMVGEIRDSETAKTAVQAALTGHLVLATLHAIDADRVRTRLIDMGVEAFRHDACLTGALTQRLVRKLCSACKTPVPLNADQVSHYKGNGLSVPPFVYEPVGCKACCGKGYLNRFAISVLTSQNNKKHEDDNLQKAALLAVAKGETSLYEIAGMGE
ncbi:MAG: GspE/PulE family protein [Pseudomonadota bacterium]